MVSKFVTHTHARARTTIKFHFISEAFRKILVVLSLLQNLGTKHSSPYSNSGIFFKKKKHFSPDVFQLMAHTIHAIFIQPVYNTAERKEKRIALYFLKCMNGISIIIIIMDAAMLVS